MRHIAVRIEKAAKRVGAAVVCQQARQHQDGMTIAQRRDRREPWTHQPESTKLWKNTHFEQPERGRRRRECFLAGRHRIVPMRLRAAPPMTPAPAFSCLDRCPCCDLAHPTSIAAESSIVRRLMGLPHWYQKPICWFGGDQHVATPLFGALMLWRKSGCSLAVRKACHSTTTQTSSTDQLRGD